ncbi:MAG: EAL domain-containing protein [Candidatus Omnitrophota bacterium]
MRKKRVLLIDDEVDFVNTLALLLQTRGYETKTYYGCIEAFKHLEEEDPDIILLDIMMPEMDGFKACAFLRQNKVTKTTPIIMLTAKSLSKDKVEGLKLGADDYIEKDAEPEELFARIESVLRRYESFKNTRMDRGALLQELRSIIDKELISVLYQPIVDMRSKKTAGYELFSRGPKGSKLEMPQKLFEFAIECELIFDLEQVVRRKSLPKMSREKDGVKFFVNNSPSILHSGKMPDLLSIYPNPKNIVLEITEETKIPDLTAFARILLGFKDKGFQIAIDDVGSGFSSLESIVELQPDFAKLSRTFVSDIHIKPNKQDLVRSILSICKRASIALIAEGIEKEEELRILKKIGVPYGQGYLLGRPQPYQD